MDQNECIICFENLYDKDISVLKCGHFYHSECIKKWSKLNNTCPCCNINIQVDHILINSNTKKKQMKSQKNIVSTKNNFSFCDNLCCLFPRI